MKYLTLILLLIVSCRRQELPPTNPILPESNASIIDSNLKNKFVAKLDSLESLWDKEYNNRTPENYFEIFGKPTAADTITVNNRHSGAPDKKFIYTFNGIQVSIYYSSEMNKYFTEYMHVNYSNIDILFHDLKSTIRNRKYIESITNNLELMSTKGDTTIIKYEIGSDVSSSIYLLFVDTLFVGATFVPYLE